jgi:hypothetical protein
MKKSSSGPFLRSALIMSLAALATAGQSTFAATAVKLDDLQGYWEGEGSGGKCVITITGNSLHYQVGTNWFATTFILPENTNPQQLHATIKEAIGKVVYAIFKIEDGTLTFAETDGSDEPPESFASASSRYVVKKIQRPKKSAESAGAD